jgi:transcriptional regulator with XRE-family HTH domain
MTVRLVPEAMKLARRASGFSQVELARRSGLSIAYIGMMETGRRLHPTPPALEAIAQALGVSPDVITRKDRAKPKKTGKRAKQTVRVTQHDEKLTHAPV